MTRRANGAALATAIAHGVTPKLWHRTPLGYAALLRPPPEHSGDRLDNCERNPAPLLGGGGGLSLKSPRNNSTLH